MTWSRKFTHRRKNFKKKLNMPRTFLRNMWKQWSAIFEKLYRFFCLQISVVFRIRGYRGPRNSKPEWDIVFQPSSIHCCSSPSASQLFRNGWPPSSRRLPQKPYSHSREREQYREDDSRKMLGHQEAMVLSRGSSRHYGSSPPRLLHPNCQSGRLSKSTSPLYHIRTTPSLKRFSTCSTRQSIFIVIP